MALQLHVNAVSGQLCTIAAERTWSAQEVKTAIQASTGIPVSQQRILVGSTELNDGMLVDSLQPAGTSLDVTLLRRSQEQAKWLAEVQRSWT
eukprot:CAMPEP_0179260844 /NCGR_PEP_ID=MMETSP0797-20121207/26549_1 /TAXON_ID=47934 /ORGANISM="Dinophysis acuminata, Strain DAEP01" /LENGTH=91 /DNA_ID=CAMNT_0020968937 /DNA_START=33 /DNA_END=304 /DNA_ORIENTATION=+